MSQIDTLESFFSETIQKMERQFTSHEFFLKLLHSHQSEYVAALASYSDPMPFRKLHCALTECLKKLDGKSITVQQTNYPSRDIFGIASTTTLWRKK
ncbi:MAG TPA: hypothetical protein ENK59_03540 [Thioploca sp.]|nr:hypothetical protein [Thioploca sp.]